MWAEPPAAVPAPERWSDLATTATAPTTAATSPASIIVTPFQYAAQAT